MEPCQRRLIVKVNVPREANPKVVVVYCVDPRFQEAFNFLIKEKLGLIWGKFVPLTIEGGASILARPESYEQEFSSLLDRICFCLEHFSSIEQIALVNHEDCNRTKATKEISIEDLQNATANLNSQLSWPSSIEIKLFYVDFNSIEAIPIEERLATKTT